MRSTFGSKIHANLCKIPQLLASEEKRFFPMEEAEKVSFKMIPNLPWFIAKSVRNRSFCE